jgi:ribonuclease T2
MSDESERSHLEDDRRFLSERAKLHALAVGIGRVIRLAAALGLSLLLSDYPALAKTVGKPFDYYAMSLSWSPTYCGEASRPDERQCGVGRAYAFVLHGLWPQFEKGWPENCESPEGWVPDALIRGMLDIMPSKPLIIHEWKKHGTCSGLAMADYFALARTLFAKLAIPARYLSPAAEIVTTPDQMMRDFVKTNGALTQDMISIQCGNDRGRAGLREILICFDRAGMLHSCGANEANRCRATQLVLPPVRH